jgi:phosphate transport system substrate-binding protein
MKKIITTLITTLLLVSMAAFTLIGCGSAKEDAASAPGDAVQHDTAADDSTDTGSGAGVSGLISVISREDGSGTRGAFIELFDILEEADGNRTDHTTLDAVVANSTEIVISNVTGDPNAIGYVSLGSLNDSVNALQINGVDATIDNVKNGKYEISRPFNIATKGSPNGVTQDFIHYILSADGQKVVEANGYIKVDESSAAYSGKSPKGKIVIAGSSSVSPVMEKLIEAYKGVNTNVDIELQTSDSTTGLQATLDGTADIGMASRELKDSEGELTPAVIAIDGIVVITNKENTITTMTPDEIKDIFTGNKTQW